MERNRLVLILLRLGLAAVFVYPAIAALISPDSWIGYFPKFMTQIVSANVLLWGFSAYELALAAWLLWGWRVYLPALLSAATMGGIIFTNLGAFDTTFRDVAIAFMSLALAVASFGSFRNRE